MSKLGLPRVLALALALAVASWAPACKDQKQEPPGSATGPGTTPAAGEEATAASSPAPAALTPAQPAPVAEGSVAPDFTMPAHDGTTVTLAALRGRPVVLYFYPKDDTPG